MPRHRTGKSPQGEYTAAGALIAALRVHKGVNQHELADAASISVSYISRFENGYRPEREVLEAALKALDAPYPHYQEIMEAFHYIPAIKEPRQDEIDRMVTALQSTIQASIFPVFLRDTLTRILEWNHLFPKISPALRNIELLRQKPVAYLLHDPEHYEPHFTGIISNAKAFAEQQVPILYHEWQQSLKEPWCEDMLLRLLRNFSFAELWNKTANEAALPSILTYKTRWNIPLHLQHPNGTLSFHMSVDYIQEDHRFAFVTFIPANLSTLEQCVAWNKSE
ncbi:MAG: helix-turn-helix domain-containing protein [Desulfobulbaceae bacterium]|nr:helix-turn-helix domain-containing protein [Desulfobulbaceae bacterium]